MKVSSSGIGITWENIPMGVTIQAVPTIHSLFLI